MHGDVLKQVVKCAYVEYYGQCICMYSKQVSEMQYIRALIFVVIQQLFFLVKFNIIRAVRKETIFIFLFLYGLLLIAVYSIATYNTHDDDAYEDKETRAASNNKYQPCWICK